MVVAHATVDPVSSTGRAIAELKARHPLGDAVEAAGVALRGKGRVRQGVCPFHREAEGSFTVYADTEKFYCFGCGSGGDVLDFMQRMEGLTLPEAIRRLDGGSPPVTAAAVRPAAVRQPAAPAIPPRDPGLLTAAARFYAGELRRSPKARAYLASRGIGAGAVLKLGLGYAPGHGLREALTAAGFGGPAAQGLRPVPGTGRGAVRRDDHSARFGPRAGAVADRAGDRRWSSAPLPGSARPQAGARVGQPRPRTRLGNCQPRASSTGLALTYLGLSWPSTATTAVPRAWTTANGCNSCWLPPWSTCPSRHRRRGPSWQRCPTCKLMLGRRAAVVKGVAQRPLVNSLVVCRNLLLYRPALPGGAFAFTPPSATVPRGLPCPSPAGASRPAHGFLCRKPAAITLHHPCGITTTTAEMTSCPTRTATAYHRNGAVQATGTSATEPGSTAGVGTGVSLRTAFGNHHIPVALRRNVQERRYGHHCRRRRHQSPPTRAS